MSYQSKVYLKQGGAEQVVASGGKISVESGGKLVPALTPTVLGTAGAETYTAAQLGGGIIERDPNGAGRTDTTDTAANLIAALKLDVNGETATCVLINTADAAEALTLAGGSGVTVKNALQTVGQNESAILLCRRTGAAAVDLYILGA